MKKHQTYVLGGEEKMSEFIWSWTKGTHKIYTRQVDLAEQAMKEGFSVMAFKAKPHIYKF